MADFTLFLNSFLSYLLLFVLIAVLAVIAVAIGITMRKKKKCQGGCGSPDPGDRRSTGAGNAVLTEKPGEMFTFNQKEWGCPALFCE